MTNEIAFTESKSLRAEYADRTDVLDKVKALTMMPDGMHVTTEMVASYYEVGTEAIKSLVKDNRAEVESNGLEVLEGQRLAALRREFARSFEDLANPISPMTRSLALFTRRAVLNVGQLLRDSPVAQQVRCHLLDVEAGAREMSRAEILRLALAAEEELSAAKAEITVLKPKAAYVDEVVDAADMTQIAGLSANIGTHDKYLRDFLVQHRWIYRKHIGRRFSQKKQCMVDVHEWWPTSYSKKHDYFRLRPQHNAPR
ncbi:phage antirepressor KilAC domain-containing protein, partial [Streptomyces sp. N35]|uniref:phage antirepressor KilAC domain-containing protein n=1 Tax=Streptomyces sp. N35 TaxID=2795730 RepID=UPI0018F421B1